MYKLNCINGDSFYIGQTGRTFTHRFKEHIRATHITTEFTFAYHLIKSRNSYKHECFKRSTKKSQNEHSRTIPDIHIFRI
jgi:hypothetical protein